MDCKKVVLVLFDRSWGEVDWILPVLYSLKKSKPEWFILVIFLEKWGDNLKKIIKSNETLFLELKSIVDDIQLNPLSRNSQINGIKSPEQVKLILKVDDLNSSYENLFLSAKIMTFPHGPSLFKDQGIKNVRLWNCWKKSVIKHDLILTDFCDFSINHRDSTPPKKYFDTIYDAKIALVGPTPRFNGWWLNHLLNNQIFLKSKEFAISQSYKRVFLFISRGVTREFPVHIYNYVIKTIGEVILQDKNNLLLISTHPFQSIPMLLNRLQYYDPKRYIISNLHTMQLSAISDFIISVNSSCILDAISLKKPVVRFHPYQWFTESLNIDRERNIRFIFDILGLTVDVNNKEELFQYISLWYTKRDFSPWATQQKVFNNLFPLYSNSSKVAANIIINELEPEKDIDQIPKVHQSFSLISGEKKLFLECLGKDNYSLKLSMKRLKANAMPVSSVMIRELASFFDSEIIILTGTVNEFFVEEVAKLFCEVHQIETASDLYQTKYMKEFSSYDNIKLYHSSNILRLILPAIKRNILFWLNNCDGNHMPFTSKSNLSILEELKVIKESGIKDYVVLINNLRYFQPVVLDGFETNNVNLYPSLHQVLDQIDDKYEFYVLGDIGIAYPKRYNVITTRCIQACTITRLSNRYMDNKLIKSSELYISNSLSQEEKNSIRFLQYDYDSDEELGVGAHYWYWNGLIYHGENRFNEAKKCLNEANKRGLSRYWKGL